MRLKSRQTLIDSLSLPERTWYIHHVLDWSHHPVVISLGLTISLLLINLIVPHIIADSQNLELEYRQ